MRFELRCSWNASGRGNWSSITGLIAVHGGDVGAVIRVAVSA